MSTIADCKQGEIIVIPHGRFIVESVEGVTGMFGRAEKHVTLRKVDADNKPVEGDGAVMRFQGVDEMVLR